MSSLGIGINRRLKLENDTNTKKCTTCKRVVEMKYFINKQNGSETKTCLSCRNSKMKTSNKEGTKRKEMNDYYNKIKNEGKCEFCGDNNASHLEFDHINPKTKVDAVTNMKTLMAMKKEMDKCRVLCKKCHRKVTKEQNNQLKKKENVNREYINSIKIKIGKCQNESCNDIFDKDNLNFYEFDHINQEEKQYTVSQMGGEYFSFAHLDKEIAKCRLLCSYCHFDITKLQNKENYKLFDVKDDLGRIEQHKDETILAVKIFYMTGNFNHPNLSEIFGLARTYITRIINGVRGNNLILSKNSLKTELIKYIAKVYSNDTMIEKYQPPRIKYSNEQLLALQILFTAGDYNKKKLSKKMNINMDLLKKYTNEKRKDYRKTKFNLKIKGFKENLMRYIIKAYL